MRDREGTFGFIMCFTENGFVNVMEVKMDEMVHKGISTLARVRLISYLN